MTAPDHALDNAIDLIDRAHSHRNLMHDGAYEEKFVQMRARCDEAAHSAIGASQHSRMPKAAEDDVT